MATSSILPNFYLSHAFQAEPISSALVLRVIRRGAHIPAVLINLDRSPDRLARMQAEFVRVGMEFERFPAVDGTALPESVRAWFCDDSGTVASPLGAGETGCYASHLAVWQRIASGHLGPGPVLVCEDDLALPDNMPALLGEILAQAPAGWDIIRLSSRTTRPVVTVASLADGRALVRFTRSPLETGAYLITPRGASKLLRGTGIRKLPVDRDLARPWIFDLRELGVLPPLIQQNIGASIIGESAGGRSRDRSLLRRLSERWHRFFFNVKTLGAWQMIRARRQMALTCSNGVG